MQNRLEHTAGVYVTILCTVRNKQGNTGHSKWLGHFFTLTIPFALVSIFCIYFCINLYFNVVDDDCYRSLFIETSSKL